VIDDREVEDRVLRLGRKIAELIDAEEDAGGIAGLLLGMGVGMFVAGGATDEMARSACDAAIESARARMREVNS
jgi:hypothetical protein